MNNLRKNKTMNALKTLTTLAATLGILATTLGAAHAQDGNWRVRITLTTVRCYATEDNTGSDEFYGIGAFGVNLPSGNQVGRGYLVGPAISINSSLLGTKKTLNKVIFSEVVPEHTEINGTFTAYDEDVSKNWTKVRKDVNEAMDKAAAGAGKLGDKGAMAEGIISAGMGVIDALALLDDDDVLGSQGFPTVVVDTEDPRFTDGKETISGPLWFSSTGLITSDFNYRVDYKIECTETFSAKPTMQ